MKNGAPPHIGRQMQRLLRETFKDDRLISRRFLNPQPVRSPDLDPCDIWLLVYLKDRVYQGYVPTLRDLKSSIRQHVAEIPRELLRAISLITIN